MKKIIYLFIATAFLVSCNDDEMAEAFSDSGWIDFATASTSTTGNDGELMLPINVNLGTNLEGQTIQYSVELVSGTVNDASHLGTFSTTIPSGDKTGSLAVNTNATSGSYTLLVKLLSSSGMYDMGLSDGSKINEHTITVCPLELSAAFTALEVVGPAGPTPNGFPINVVDLGGNQFSLDTSWGPEYIFTTCAGCVPAGDYVGPITISITPATTGVIHNVTVVAGGEPSGVGNTFDIAYTIGDGGGGTYDSCTGILDLTLIDNDLFGTPLTVSLQGN